MPSQEWKREVTLMGEQSARCLILQPLEQGDIFRGNLTRPHHPRPAP